MKWAGTKSTLGYTPVCVVGLVSIQLFILSAMPLGHLTQVHFKWPWHLRLGATLPTKVKVDVYMDV